MNLEIFFNLMAGTRLDEDVGVYVGWCPALDVRSQGATVEEAKLALEDAIFLFLKHYYARNILDDTLNARGFELDHEQPPSRRGAVGDQQVISVRPVGPGYSDYNVQVPFHLIQQQVRGRGNHKGVSCP